MPSQLKSIAQRREAGLALTMLPVGAIMLVVSALAIPAVLTLGVDVAMRQPSGWSWTLAWCLAATAIALWNMRAGIAMMCALDWRPLPFASLRSAAVVAGWLALP